MDVIDALQGHIQVQVLLIAYVALLEHIQVGNILHVVFVKKELNLTQIARDVILALQEHIQHQNHQNVITVPKGHFLIEAIRHALHALRDIMQILRAHLNVKDALMALIHIYALPSVLNAQKEKNIAAVQ